MKAWGGDPASVSMTILCSNETRVSIATIIQANLAKIGINVKVESMDTATYFDKWAIGEYDALIASWSPANDLTYINRYSPDRRQQYAGSYNNPEMNTLIEEANMELDAAERTKKVENIVATVPRSHSINPCGCVPMMQSCRVLFAVLLAILTGIWSIGLSKVCKARAPVNQQMPLLLLY